MRPVMRLLLGLGALVLILGGVALALPSYVTVARSVVINAPESAVFPYLNNLHRFNDWSPWAARDPQMQATFSGPEEGKGAKIAWTSSQRSVGDGSISITDSNPNRHIDLAVAANGVEGPGYYDVAPSGSGSKVTWGFGYETGTSPLKRWKGLLLDRFIGSEYGNGLAKLKDRIETDRRPTAPSATAVPPMTAPMGTPVVPGQPTPTPEAVEAAPSSGPPPPTAAPAETGTTAPTPEAEPAPPPPAQSTAPKKKRQ